MPPTPKIPPDLALLLTLGWSLAAWLTAGVLAGRWAGAAWSLEPWGTLCGALLGLAGAGVTMFRVVRRLDRADRSPRHRDRSSRSVPDAAVGAAGSKTKSKHPDQNLP